MGSESRIRTARVSDLDALMALEEQGFTSDRFTSTQVRGLITKAQGAALVIEAGGRIAGSAFVLWRKGSSVARLYSIAMDPAFRGRGLGRQLMEAAEEAAAAQACTAMSLEVRTDNTAAIALYRKLGYRVTRTLEGYHEDGADAYKMVRDLEGAEPVRLDVPYYAQTTEFSCGAACLMMALRHFDPTFHIDRTVELNLWREATLIYTTSGLGGSGPFGIAAAAARRGRNVDVMLSDRRVPFIATVRREDKKEVIRLLHVEHRRQAADLGVETTYGDFRLSDLAVELQAGMVPIVLISTWRLHAVRVPHWVVLTGYDAENVYFHDPYDGFYEADKKAARNLAIPIDEFDKMRRHSRDVRKAAVLVGK